MSLPREFHHELHKHFTGDIRTDLASRILYSTDASIYQIEPMGVALPRTQEDLIAAVELAAKYKIPILPRGAGTSLAGQAIGNALILDCSRWLDHIAQINPDEHYAIVEPGVVHLSIGVLPVAWRRPACSSLYGRTPLLVLFWQVPYDQMKPAPGRLVVGLTPSASQFVRGLCSRWRICGAV